MKVMTFRVVTDDDANEAAIAAMFGDRSEEIVLGIVPLIPNGFGHLLPEMTEHQVYVDEPEQTVVMDALRAGQMP